MLRRYQKLLLVLAVFTASLFLTLVERDRFLPSLQAESASGAGPKQPEPGAYKLSNLHVMNSVLLYLSDCYVEPEKFDPPKMLRAALKGIESDVPDIIVRIDDEKQEAEVEVDTAHKTFDVSGINSPWSMSARLKSIFEFIQSSLKNDEIELQDVEYAAVNGMLGTLDPHTRLLTPEYFEEMKLDTEGEFGGLGIVISSPEGKLIINEILPGTPAEKNGLECGDEIVQIEEESTVNMDVTEAVERLRGKKGTTVTIWIAREGWKSAKAVEIERAQIHIDSVKSKMLAGEVGYVQISGFQENTYEDLRIHLEKLKKQGMRGLVLDLRDNSGGLLEISKQVADVFLFAGNILTTWVPCDKNPKEVSSAHVTGTEPNYPMVLLVNRGSASASEIVAGALKNQDRVVVLGERTFGKGSIQQLKEMSDGSALKYTIGQYLTPGDISIQGVGIEPDILLTPMFVEADGVDIFAEDEDVFRESDLEESLQGKGEKGGDKPFDSLSYVFVKPGKSEGLCPAGLDDLVKFDSEIKVAAEIVRQVTSTSRPKMLQQAMPIVAQERDAQEALLVKELKKLKIDWESCKDTAPGDSADIEVSFQKDGKKVDRIEAEAGDAFDLTVTVHNKGKGTFCRLYAFSESDNGLMSGREFLVGKLKPGQKKSWTEKVKIPRQLSSRTDPVLFTFHEEHGVTPATREIRLDVSAPLEPAYSVAWQILDDISGDGDGFLEKGEEARLRLYVKNKGTGRSESTVVSIKNQSGQGIFITKGREVVEDIEPGETVHADFKLKMLDGYDGDGFRLELLVVDVDLAVRFKERIELDAVGGPGGKIEEKPGTWEVLVEGASLLPSADPSVARLGALPAGTILLSDRTVGELVRARLPDEGWSWMKATDLLATAKKPDPKAPPGITFAFATGMPVIVMEKDPAKCGISGDWTTRGEKVTLSGNAIGEGPIEDMYVYVGDEKVFYRSVRDTDDPTRLDFELEIELAPGVNYVLVTVRQSPLNVTRKLLVIRRDAPDGSTMETPKKKLTP